MKAFSICSLALIFLAAATTAEAQRSRSRSSGKAEGWNQWRGPKRDNISPDTGLLKQWPGGGPKLAWKATGLGNGYSSVSFSGGKIYTMGETGGKTNVIALNEEDGKILWATPVGTPGGNRGTGPRGTPATDGKMVFAICQNGEFVAVDAARGRKLWAKNLGRDFGASRPGWYYSESPLIDGNFVVATAPNGGGTSVFAVTKTGRLAWKSQKVKGGGAMYTSLAIAEMGRVKQYLVFTDKAVAGVLANRGTKLWENDFPGRTAICSTPLYNNGVVFVAAGYGVGCTGVSVAVAGSRIKYQELYHNQNMKNHHGGMVMIGDHVYGTDDGGSLTCIEAKTGKVVWQDRCVGKGSVTAADGLLFVRSEGGAVALVEATPEGYKEKGRFNQPDRSNLDAWAHPVVFNGKLYLRDQDVLLCYDVKE